MRHPLLGMFAGGIDWITPFAFTGVWHSTQVLRPIRIRVPAKLHQQKRDLFEPKTARRQYDRRRGPMTVRENLHQLVDALPEDRLDDVLDYLAELNDTDETLSAETEAAIEEGLEDVRQGRTITIEEYRRTRGL